MAVALHDELRRNPPDRLSPALLLHGALRAHLRREKPDRRATVLLELGPGSGYASVAPEAARGGRGGRAGRGCGGRGLGRVPALLARRRIRDVRALDLRARVRRRVDRRPGALMQPGCISARSE